MKTCTYCGNEYSDDILVCAIDHEPLNQAALSRASNGSKSSRWQSAFTLAVLQTGAWICFLLGILMLAEILETLSYIRWRNLGEEDVQSLLFVLVSFLPFLAVVYPKFRLPEKWSRWNAG